MARGRHARRTVFDPAEAGALRHVSSFSKGVGGAELNVAVGLARLEHRSASAGRLGDDEFGSEILAFIGERAWIRLRRGVTPPRRPGSTSRSGAPPVTPVSTTTAPAPQRAV
ncbi:MAG: PfkB family carbohydrate kinase [Rubrobacter sp.]